MLFSPSHLSHAFARYISHDYVALSAVIQLPVSALLVQCAGSQQVAGLTDSPFMLHLPHEGTFYYACSVPSHCEVGMLITVSVSGGSKLAQHWCCEQMRACVLGHPVHATSAA